MFLLVSVCHVGAHPGGHQHGVSIQISINLGKIFLRISCIRNILQKNNLQLARAALFFVHFLAVVVVAMWNFLSSCTFCGENVLCAHKKFWCLFSCSLFFFYCRNTFSPCWPLAFPIFSPRQQNFRVIFPTKFVSFVFCLSQLPASLSPTSRFLCLSLSLYSKFVDMKINLRSILQTTRTQEQFPLFVLSAEKSFRHVSILAKFLDDKKPKFHLRWLPRKNWPCAVWALVWREL